MTSRIAGWAVLAVLTAGCSSDSKDSGGAATTAAPQSAPAPAAVEAKPNVEVGTSPAPGAAAAAPVANPGEASAPSDAAIPPAQAAATANAAAEAKLNEPVSGDELASACKANCKRVIECMPKGAQFSNQQCIDSCGATPNEGAKRYAIEQMKRCQAKTECNDFNSCMAGGAPAAAPPANAPAKPKSAP